MRIVIGVTGGIAAYKTATVVSALAQRGHEVTVCMTPGAMNLVAPLTFQALSGRAVLTSIFEHAEPTDPQHIRVASCDVALVAPCTMDCLANLAHGHASDIVTLVLSAIDRTKTPVYLAPSMNVTMWGQPSTRRNVAQLEADGYRMIGPGEGWQACREVGAGRMAEPDEILRVLEAALAGGSQDS
ncbi:MAG: phosphopantothenoylcysteine decarboxylase [Phycisphaerales bacterium]|nr:phosphopantothenoylcysteine decarboxylase [Phycisphaerales bacterium]